MGLCSSSPAGGMPYGGEGDFGPGMGGGEGFEGDVMEAPPSPQWKLPQFPAPALPPLTRANKLIIACSRYLEDVEEQAKTKRLVLNGQGDALSIVFDDPDQYEMFIPEVKKLFSLALALTSLELHTANLDVDVDFLQSFLDTLPSHGALKAFSLVTARDTPLVFSAISGLLYRNPNLQALRLWGPDLTVAGAGNQSYPTCKLLRVDVSCCKLFPQQIDNILGGAAESLLCLKLEKNIGLSGTQMARAINQFGKKVQMLTLLLPAESESEMDHKASYLVGDTASRFPTSLKYLHCAGLAASDNLFNVTPSMDGVKKGQPPKTHLSQLVALRLDNCPRVSVNGLFAAIRQKSLPNLLRLHAFWLERDDIADDVEIWRNFAASEEIRVDTETEGLVHVTALKEAPTTLTLDPRDPSQTMHLPVRPPPVMQVNPRAYEQLQPLFRGAESRRGSHESRDSRETRERYSRPGHGRKDSRSPRSRERDRRRKRYSEYTDYSGDSEDSDDSDDDYSESDDSYDSDDSDYHRSSKRNRSRRPSGRVRSSSRRRR